MKNTRKLGKDTPTVVSVRLPGYLKNAITEKAEQEEIPVGSMIRKLLREALKISKHSAKTT
jgi:hypothetical protein